jgi:transcriptional regulator with XRE-family HTH domain
MSSYSKIKSLRLKRRLSQNGLSRKAELDRATVAAAENGKSVSDLTLSKIADALGVEVGDIDERP